MSTDANLQELLKKNAEEHTRLVKSIGQSAKAWAEAVKTQGVLVEYHAENDYLYVVLGGVSREGMAVTVMGISVIVDPESHEVLGLEIPFFQEHLNKGLLPNKRWYKIAELVQQHPNVFLPPERESEQVRDLAEQLLAAV